MGDLSEAGGREQPVGAAYNPYALAVKLHMQKKATGEDIQKTAVLIVDELSKHKDDFKAEAKKNAK
jgi:hypothetical protein